MGRVWRGGGVDRSRQRGDRAGGEAADVGNVSMLYLPAVLVTAVLFGRRAAIVASVASFLAFNFFFIEPRYEFSVADEEEWVALALLLGTGLVTGQLAASLRRRALDGGARARGGRPL